MIVGIQLPDAASQARTRAVVEKVKSILRKTPGVGNWFLIGGQVDPRPGGRLQRRGHVHHVHALGGADRQARPEPGGDPRHIRGSSAARSARRSIFAFPPPAIQGLGVAGGFQMQLEDRGGVGTEGTPASPDEMVRDGNGQTGLTGACRAPSARASRSSTPTSTGRRPRAWASRSTRSSPRSRPCSARRTSTTSTSSAGRSRSGSRPTSEFRLEPEDIRRLEVRNQQGKMVPLGTLVRVEKRLGPQIIPRYNLYPSASITGEAAPGSARARC